MKKLIFILFVLLFSNCNGQNFFGTHSGTFPTITTTTPIIDITNNSASGGGTVISDGGLPTTTYGLCWNTSTNPTTANSKAEASLTISGPFGFTQALISLAPSTLYYVRAYAINTIGTAYGDNVTFTTADLAIGDAYQGGVIAYLDGTGLHGFIAAASDQSSGIRWYNGTYGDTGAIGSVVGAATSNTNSIVSTYGSGSYAAKLCYDLSLNGYTDWQLPTTDELDILYYTKATIGGFSGGQYWSSTQFNSNGAWFQYFSSGIVYYSISEETFYVRAIRYF